jgi:hypothetical protein
MNCLQLDQHCPQVELDELYRFRESLSPTEPPPPYHSKMPNTAKKMPNTAKKMPKNAQISVFPFLIRSRAGSN